MKTVTCKQGNKQDSLGLLLASLPLPFPWIHPFPRALSLSLSLSPFVRSTRRGSLAEDPRAASSRTKRRFPRMTGSFARTSNAY